MCISDILYSRKTVLFLVIHLYRPVAWCIRLNMRNNFRWFADKYFEIFFVNVVLLPTFASCMPVYACVCTYVCAYASISVKLPVCLSELL